ncbi:MAG: hypothetical protein ACREHF_08805 [Rhizomicrobium sp.]
MTELDLLNLARSVTSNEVGWFGQIITINFAMVVGIYYFLNRAQLALKLFAFAAYLLGMLLYWGQILLESNVKLQAFRWLRAMPHLSPMTQAYLDIDGSWLGILTAILLNGAFWILIIGIFYLLFFWTEIRRN